METAQKMVENAAKRAGYTIKAYHGTNGLFYKFKRGKKGLLGPGIYLTDDKRYAARYTDFGEDGIMPLYALSKNPLIINGRASDVGKAILEILGKEDKYEQRLAANDALGNVITTADIKALQAMGYDSIFWKVGNTIEYNVFSPEQIKSAEPVVYDNKGNIIPLSERFNPEKNDIRFSLTGDLNLGDTSLSPEDYRRSIDPLFDFVMEYTDGIVNPGPEHIGEDFDGSYISEAYNKFSTKRKQGKKESDASYQRYLAHRQEMLNKADGYSLDTLAAAYVDKFGGDEKEVAEKILDMLRYLRKRDLTFIHKDHQQPIANQLIKQSGKSYLNGFEIIP
jgi:hypothetical protein